MARNRPVLIGAAAPSAPRDAARRGRDPFIAENTPVPGNALTNFFRLVAQVKLPFLGAGPPVKTAISQLVAAAVDPLAGSELPAETRGAQPQIDRTRDPRHGDFASNIALVLAKPARRKPREIAELIVGALPDSELVAGVEIAGPGFINFRLTPLALHREIGRILADGARYGESDEGAGRKVIVEFVSANPTGPLHVGHGRHAAYGDSVANLLAATGHDVHREYYVNDAGRQMDILAVSVWLRYLERCGETVAFPSNGYRGDYIRDIAADLALSLIHISEPTRQLASSRMPSSA